MTFTRVSILGATGLALLQLSACGSPKGAGQTGDGARDERIGQTSEDPDAGTNPPPKKCSYDPSKPDEIKWKNTLIRPRKFVSTTPKGNDYTVTVREHDVQMLPDCYPTTQVFAYGGSTIGFGETEAKEDFSSPGPTFEMTRGAPAHVTWVNAIRIDHPFPIDPTLHWANPNQDTEPATGPFPTAAPFDPKWQKLIPIVTHVHGLEVAADSDGAPDAWFTLDPEKKGARRRFEPSEYPNSQPATTLWYHDHALGMTRLNVYAGLAGMYIIREEKDANAAQLPDEAHEMPLVIQDKSFNPDGSLNYPAQPDDATHHPYWFSFFSGDTIVVNGKVWPKMTVERTRYRFRILNGANSRTFNLSLPTEYPITVIGSDGGYLASPAGTPTVKLAPGERADVVIDFSALAAGKSVIMSNDGEDIVKFETLPAATEAQPQSCFLTPDSDAKIQLPLCFPKGLVDKPVELGEGTKRTVTLIQAPDQTPLLNGQAFHSAASEEPKLGSTEDWDIVNTMGDDHPIHLHLVQFKLRERLNITEGYLQKWKEDNGNVLPLHDAPKNPAVDEYTTGDPLPITALDTGWKDTIVVPGYSVTRIRVRWAPRDSDKFPFDATQGSYVWHCHMLEHEDNEMMRPLAIK